MPSEVSAAVASYDNAKSATAPLSGRIIDEEPFSDSSIFSTVSKGHEMRSFRITSRPVLYLSVYNSTLLGRLIGGNSCPADNGDHSSIGLKFQAITRLDPGAAPDSQPHHQRISFLDNSRHSQPHLKDNRSCARLMLRTTASMCSNRSYPRILED